MKAIQSDKLYDTDTAKVAAVKRVDYKSAPGCVDEWKHFVTTLYVTEKGSHFVHTRKVGQAVKYGSIMAYPSSMAQDFYSQADYRKLPVEEVFPNVVIVEA